MLIGEIRTKSNCLVIAADTAYDNKSIGRWVYLPVCNSFCHEHCEIQDKVGSNNFALPVDNPKNNSFNIIK